MPFNHGVRADFGVCANLDVFADNAVRTHGNTAVQLCFGVDDGGGVDSGHFVSFVKVCGVQAAFGWPMGLLFALCQCAHRFDQRVARIHFVQRPQLIVIVMYMAQARFVQFQRPMPAVERYPCK